MLTLAQREVVLLPLDAVYGSFRDSPDESQTGINARVFPALLQDRPEVLTATSTSGNPNAWSRLIWPFSLAFGRTPSVGCLNA
jgi:hypothetical protein